jgi:mRNA-degrading endonuclease RelE of RelBE toxin-antitoxin system
MGGRVTYLIEFTPEAVEHLAQLPARQKSSVLDAIEIQLKHEPTVETRNRKRIRLNRLAPWELRVGSTRVYYDAVAEPRAVVTIRAIGVKHRERIRIGRTWWQA